MDGNHWIDFWNVIVRLHWTFCNHSVAKLFLRFSSGFSTSVPSKAEWDFLEANKKGEIHEFLYLPGFIFKLGSTTINRM